MLCRCRHRMGSESGDPLGSGSGLRPLSVVSTVSEYMVMSGCLADSVILYDRLFRSRVPGSRKEASDRCDEAFSRKIRGGGCQRIGLDWSVGAGGSWSPSKSGRHLSLSLSLSSFLPFPSLPSYLIPPPDPRLYSTGLTVFFLPLARLVHLFHSLVDFSRPSCPSPGAV